MATERLSGMGGSSGQAERSLPGRERFTYQFAEYFNPETSHTLSTRSLKTAQLTATRVTATVHGTGMSSPLPTENAYLISLQLCESGSNELWKAGRHVPAPPLQEGSLVITHLEEEPAAYLPKPFDALLLHIPQIVLAELAEEQGTARITELACEIGVVDPIMQYLGRAVLPALQHPEEAGALFFDHIAFAMHSHLARRYGSLAQRAESRGVYLNRRLEQLAKDLLAANLTAEPPVSAVAAACGMPVGQFIRAFRATTGMPPHRWVRSFRVQRAKELLERSPHSLALIAYECGFSDQSHMTRVFSAAVGITPGAWRRNRRS